MEGSNNDLQAIEKISGAVEESQVKIIFSDQCRKAQAVLVNRFKKQFDHQKEVSKFISNDNLKLEAEINNAEQEIKSLMLAHESIKSSNVELKKEWQLAKERTKETVERIQIGEKKYDELWEQCKSRYESICFVQNWLQTTKKKEALEEDVNVLDKEIRELNEEIKTKEAIISTLNKKRIVELAEYFAHEKPKIERNISILSKEIEKLNDEIKQFTECEVVQNKQTREAADIAGANIRTGAHKLKIDDGWPYLNKNLTSNVNTLMPKLQLMNLDLDGLSVKLDQIKKSDLVATSPVKEVNLNHNTTESGLKITLTPDKRQNEYTSVYFNKLGNTPSISDVTYDRNNKDLNYSKRKLINILQDIKLDKNETYNLVSKVNLDNLQGVTVITANLNNNNDGPSETNEKDKDEVQDVEIEEVDLPSSNVEQIILPPSGFLDQLRGSQEKRRVSFELPSSVQELSLDPKNGNPKDDVNGENDVNVTNSLINESVESEESFTKMKDMILKKHNLDLSPQFVYGKNTTMHLKNDEVARSNYFKLSCEDPQPSMSGTLIETAKVPNEADDNEMDCDEPVETNIVDNAAEDDNVEMEVDENAISGAQENQEQNITKPVAGLLFSHGPLGLPDSLDISINTTGFEEGDPDYPQYSSLLLSPKADLPTPSTNEKAEVINQDVPNFLSGFRKSAVSFFGNMAGTDSNTDSVTTQTGKNNFNFAFGSDEKKSRGGLFNMFN